MRPRRREAGFTLTEMMVVVVILGVLAAIAAPTMGRDRSVREGREFVREVSRELQRARMLAVTDRLRTRVYFYPNRVEVRSYTQATPISAPAAPALTDTPEFRVTAKNRILVYNVVTTGTPAKPTGTTSSINPTAPITIEFDTMGNVVGDKTIYVYIRNDGAPEKSLEREFRIDIAPLTGYVDVRPVW